MIFVSKRTEEGIKIGNYVLTIMVMCFNSLHTNVALNSLDTDQDRHNVVSGLDINCLTLIWFPESFF